MKHKTIKAYCPKCDIYHELEGIEKKVDFIYMGKQKGEKYECLLNQYMCKKEHMFSYNKIMKYQVTRKC